MILDEPFSIPFVYLTYFIYTEYNIFHIFYELADLEKSLIAILSEKEKKQDWFVIG